MDSSTPATGEGSSVSTLSVDISRSGSSCATASPTAFSQRVTVPSVTDSPSAGRVTGVPAPDATAGAGLAAGVGAATGAAGASCGGASGCADSATGWAVGSAVGWAAGFAAGAGAGAAASSPITASSAPTGTVSSSWATMRTRTPDAGAGISVSTLSVETSSSGSSAWTASPSFLSQRVTVPSVTLSPSAGIVTETVMRGDSPRQPWVCSGLPASAR